MVPDYLEAILKGSKGAPWAAGVPHLVFLHCGFEHHIETVWVEVGQRLGGVGLSDLDVQLGDVAGPGTKGVVASLDVKGPVDHVHHATTMEEGGRHQGDPSGVLHLSCETDILPRVTVARRVVKGDVWDPNLI